MSKILRTTVLTAALAAVLAACGQATIASDELQDQVAKQLTESVGEAPDSVSCPDDLDAEVGATTRCELVAGDTRVGVTVEVTKVDGDTATFDITVDDEPLP